VLEQPEATRSAVAATMRLDVERNVIEVMAMAARMGRTLQSERRATRDTKLARGNPRTR
jgi:hypothetical protein